MKHLTDGDRYYLRMLLENACDMGPDDPDAMRLYTVEDCVVEEDSPFWTHAQVAEVVDAFQTQHGLRVRLEWKDERGSLATLDKDGGVIQLDSRWSGVQYVPSEPGKYLAAAVLHELAHILTPQISRPGAVYNTRAFQSHGPEFRAVYLRLLGEHLDTTRTEAAMTFMGLALGDVG